MLGWRVVSYGSGKSRKAARMIRTAVAACMAIGVALGGVWLGAAAVAQSLRVPPIPQATRALLVDHDDDKQKHGKNKHREREDDSEDEDRGRDRRSSVSGSWRDYVPPPNYYSPPPSSYSAPYPSYGPFGPYAPAAPSVSARPSTRVAPPPQQPSAPAAASTDSNRRGGAGSSGPTIQWVDPPPAR